MPRNPAAWLAEILDAGQAIQADTAGLSLGDYRVATTLPQATERNFQIIGEALVNLRDQRPDLFGRIDRASQIIGFRNTLVHAYFQLDHPTVWDAIETGLPHLLQQSRELFHEVQRESFSEQDAGERDSPGDQSR